VFADGLGQLSDVRVAGRCRPGPTLQPSTKDKASFHAYRATRSRSHESHCGDHQEVFVIRKLKSGEYRLYSRKKDPKTGKRRNLGTFSTMEKAKQHERAVQYFKRAG
jgi:hypothetical protein